MTYMLLYGPNYLLLRAARLLFLHFLVGQMVAQRTSANRSGNRVMTSHVADHCSASGSLQATLRKCRRYD